MIPKIIHLCWLSGDPFPEDILKCLRTFPLHIPDYEIFLWGKTPADISCLGGMKVTEMHFDLNSTPWTKEAFEARKYAFAADYIRLYALYTYGGIYLDADVLIYKSFDELLHLPYFIGCDQIRAFEAAVIGAQKGCMWIKDVWDTYIGKHFVKDDGSLDMMELPVRFHHVLVDKGYNFIKLSGINEFEDSICETKTLQVFDGDYFNSRNAVEVRQTPKSFCAHNYAGSWQKKTSNASFSQKVKHMLPKSILALIYTIGQATWARNKYSWFQIPFEK